MYRPISRSELVETIGHLNELHRQRLPSNEHEARAHERREVAARTLMSNIPRTKDHPTLKTLLDVAEVFSLTVEGAHRIFGYNLASIREYDLRLNGGRTHIIESYGFERDLLIDLPLQLGPEQMFATDGMLRDLVIDWQRSIPFRVLDEPAWHQPGTFYVHIGTEDSLGSSLPPGSIALVEPVDLSERERPNPRKMYLLQFANGYRCGYCVVSRGRLNVMHSERTSGRSEEFVYPAAVRIAGRIKAFALGLPAPEYRALQSLPSKERGADLILPWEHRTRDRLFTAGHQRFERSKEEEQAVRMFLEAQLHAKLSQRTERRYRYPSSSQPHVNALISMTLAHMARYTDTLKTSGVTLSDARRYSLQSMLSARQLPNFTSISSTVAEPTPAAVWKRIRMEFVEWPPLLSLKFPQVDLWQDRILRLAETSPLRGLEPAIAPGSWLLLEKLPILPDTRSDWLKTGWSRPIYVLRRGLEAICGYLDRDENRYVLVLGQQEPERRVSFGLEELSSLSRVAGIAVPV